MADYKRMVSYMYQYEKGLKKKNMGYARVELRNGQIKVTLHMQLLGQLDSIFPTYLIQRDENGMELIYLGDSMLRSQLLDSKLIANDTNIKGSGHNFSEIGGILLFLNEDIFFATEWDDKPIIAKDVMEALKPKSKKGDSKEATELTEEMIVENEEEKPLEEVISSNEDSLSNEVSPSNEDSLSNEDIFLNSEIEISSKETAVTVTTGIKSEQKQTENTETTESEIDDENLIPKYKLPGGYKFIEAFINNSVGQSDQPSTLDMAQKTIMEEEHKSLDTDKKEEIKEVASKTVATEEKSEEVKSELFKSNEAVNQSVNLEDGIQDAAIRNEAAKENKSKNQGDEEDLDNREEAEGPENPSAARIFEHYPRIYPFEDNEITMCVKIEPKDIGYLPMDAWGLSNNSFLLHGFYCYHHLIFAKVKDRFGSRYIIGVPGIYHTREQFMARMFGFENFKSIRKRDLRQGEFGYWYLILSI